MDADGGQVHCNQQSEISNLQCRQIVVAVLTLDDHLATRVISRSWNGFESTLINRIAAPRTHAIRAFSNSQQRLIDIRYDL